MAVRERRYLSFPLRLWQVRQNGNESWRASLEDSRTGDKEIINARVWAGIHYRRSDKAGADLGCKVHIVRSNDISCRKISEGEGGRIFLADASAHGEESIMISIQAAETSVGHF